MAPDEVVAALHRMRDEIDLLLASLAPDVVATDDLMGLNMGAAAFRVLARSQRPMRAPEIWKRMVAHGYSSKNGDRANVRSVSWALTLRLRQHGDVEKIGPGLWKALIIDSAPK
jgi:hypothetical protein